MRKVGKKNRPNFLPMLWALGLIASLAGLIGYDIFRQTAEVPLALRYIPTNASALIFSQDVATTWEHLEPHLGPIFRQPRGESLAEKINSTKEILAKMCIAPESAGALARFGVEPHRGAGAAAFDDGDEGAFLLVLPVTSELDFSQTVASFHLQGGEVELHDEDSDSKRKPKAFRIRRSLDAGRGKLCALADGKVLEIRDELQTVAAEGSLWFVPDWFEPSQFGIECSALYENGEEGPCRCELIPNNFKTDKEKNDCLGSVRITPEEKKVKRYRPGTITIEDLEFSGFTIDNELTVIFTPDGWAILSNKDAILPSALAAPERNLAFHQNSDALRSLAAWAQADDPRTELGLSTVSGRFRLPGLYSVSPITYDLKTTPVRLSLELGMDLPSGKMTIFDRLTRSPGNVRVDEIVPYGSKVALALNDANLSYYLRYVFDYVDRAKDGMQRALGHLTKAIVALSDVQSLDAIGLLVPEVKEGVPDLALAARIHNRDAADDIILDLQHQLRKARDVEILQKAIDRFEQDHEGTSPQSVSELLATDALTDGETAYLVQELPNTWDSYRIKDGQIVIPANLPLEIFETDSYLEDVKRADFTITSDALSTSLHYLLAPVTENDFKYRFEDLKGDQKDAAAAEREALMAGANRLCAAYMHATGTLWVGSDADVLKNIFKSGAYKRNSNAYTETKELVASPTPPKSTLFAHTGWLLNQGIGHPDGEINEIAQELIDLSDYEQLLITVSARNDRNGIKARIELFK